MYICPIPTDTQRNMYRCCILPIATIYAFFDFVLWIHFGWHACFLVFYCIIASCLTLIRVVAWTVSAFCFHGKVLMESQLLQGGGSESQTAAFSWHQSGTLFMFLVVGWLLVLLLLFFFFLGGRGLHVFVFVFPSCWVTQCDLPSFFESLLIMHQENKLIPSGCLFMTHG